MIFTRVSVEGFNDELIGVIIAILNQTISKTTQFIPLENKIDKIEDRENNKLKANRLVEQYNFPFF